MDSNKIMTECPKNFLRKKFEKFGKKFAKKLITQQIQSNHVSTRISTFTFSATFRINPTVLRVIYRTLTDGESISGDFYVAFYPVFLPANAICVLSLIQLVGLSTSM